jgi:hypothetical protein
MADVGQEGMRPGLCRLRVARDAPGLRCDRLSSPLLCQFNLIDAFLMVMEWIKIICRCWPWLPLLSLDIVPGHGV